MKLDMIDVKVFSRLVHKDLAKILQATPKKQFHNVTVQIPVFIHYEIDSRSNIEIETV